MELPENNIEYNEESSPKKNTYLIVGLFLGLFLIFLIPSIFLLLKFTQNPNNQIQETNTQKVESELTPSVASEKKDLAVLDFNPANLQINANSAQNINVLIDSKNYQATAVEMYIKFDPNYIEVVSVSPASFFEKPNVLLQKIDNQTGLVSFVIATFSPKIGNGNLITLNLKAKDMTGTSNLSFSKETVMTAKGTQESVLGPTNSATIEIIK